MRLHRSMRLHDALLPFLLFPGLSTAYTLDCKEILRDGQKWDLSELGGVHTLMHSENPPTWKNTTFTLEMCGNLEKKKGECPNGTKVCAIERNVLSDGSSEAPEVITIAGDLENHRGGHLNPKITRLRTSSSPKDSDREGLRIELYGGIYQKQKQRAIIEFLCPVVEEKSIWKKESNEEAPIGEVTEDGLQFIDYKLDKGEEYKTLYLEWITEHACESETVKTHWGFFTWILIIGFLVTAAYLIFGSWLNYNRYGARGWDLLPHGDTIRDVPYLLKDWTRRVLTTVQGSGSRGGYSAV